MNTRYLREKLYSAVFSLATGEGDLPERLEAAALSLVVLEPEQMPADIGQEYRAIYAELTKREAEIAGEGKIRATVRNLTYHEASGIAERILNLYLKVVAPEE